MRCRRVIPSRNTLTPDTRAQFQMNERADRLECESTLFEEDCEQTWEKGSSGLVFYTDDARWDAALGDFHERTADALDVDERLDVDAQCDWEAGTRDPDAFAYMEDVEGRKAVAHARAKSHAGLLLGGRGQSKLLGLPSALRPKKGCKRGGGGEENAHECLASAIAGVPRNLAAGSEGQVRRQGEVEGAARGRGRLVCEDAFDRDVRYGFAGKLCQKMGLRPGDGLGVKGDLGIVKG